MPGSHRPIPSRLAIPVFLGGLAVVAVVGGCVVGEDYAPSSTGGSSAASDAAASSSGGTGSSGGGNGGSSNGGESSGVSANGNGNGSSGGNGSGGAASSSGGSSSSGSSGAGSSSGSGGGTAAPDSSTPLDAATDAPSASADANTGVLVLVQVTWDGWDDNSPPGGAIAYPPGDGYPTLHNVAGGTGTYADPITFGSDKDEYPPGTILYLPFAQKYVIMEDDCTQCDGQWPATRAIDVWMNSDGSESADALYDCEGVWTNLAAEIMSSPPPNLPVTTTPVFDPATSTCSSLP